MAFCFSSLCDQDLLGARLCWTHFPGGQIPRGHAFWRRGSVFPFLFALGHISKVLTKWVTAPSWREGTALKSHSLCVSLQRGWGWWKGGFATWGACPAPLWRGSTQACVWFQWCPVLSCAWMIVSFFLTHWSPQFTPPVLYQAWKSSQDCIQPPPEIYFGVWMKIQSTGLPFHQPCFLQARRLLPPQPPTPAKTKPF